MLLEILVRAGFLLCYNIAKTVLLPMKNLYLFLNLIVG